MKYKILFLTESGFLGKVPRHLAANGRVDLAWQSVLDSEHLPLIPEFINKIEYIFDKSRHYDFAIVILPKNLSELADKYTADKLIMRLKQVANKIVFMQEGPHWYFQDYSVELQKWHMRFVGRCDFIFCHNLIDISYYEGLHPEKRIFVMPSVMIEDNIKDALDIVKQDKNIIGGNFCRWYGGFDSLAIVSQMNPFKTWAPSMGRKQRDEEKVVTHLPYMAWADWIHKLAEFKYAVHMMPTVAAGTFSMNCAYLGIPCIGNKQLDTQRLCFPDLSIDIHDISKAIRIGTNLFNDKESYDYISKKAQKQYEKMFSEKAYRKQMNMTLSLMT